MKTMTTELKPTDRKTRIESVDALRGFALLGIIIANIPFALNTPVSTNLDTLFSFLYHFLIDKKFITIFSILFGFGFYIQMDRAAKRQINFNKYFIIRMVLLYAIGTIHAFAIWNGDILRAYAVGGILLLLVRNWPVRRILVLALILIIVFTGGLYIGLTAFEWGLQNFDFEMAQEVNVTTSFFRYLKINALLDPWVSFLRDMPITLIFTFGNMLIGFILAKINFFKPVESVKNLKTWLLTLGLTFGLATSFIYYKITVGDIELSYSLIWIPFLLVGGIVLHSLFYIVAFLHLFQAKEIKKVLQIFNPVGRMALTNYLMQSLLYVIVFYHFVPFFQLYGKLNHFQTWIFAITFFLAQTLFSYFWLKKFKQGPIEYIWKKWSYKTAVPNSRHIESNSSADYTIHNNFKNSILEQNRTK